MKEIYSTEQIIQLIKQVGRVKDEPNVEYLGELYRTIKEGEEVDKAISSISDPRQRERFIIEFFNKRKRNFE